MASSICLLHRNKPITNLLNSLKIIECLHFYQKRSFKRWYVPAMKVLKQRREQAGPEPPRHRSVWNNWNYNAELYAFGKRLQEEFNEATLQRAFTHSSYIKQEDEKRKDLGIQTDSLHLSLNDNSELAALGEDVMRNYIPKYLRNAYPVFPDEGIRAVTDYLMSEDLVATVASNIGIADLILCADFPPEKPTLTSTLKAIVGAIAKDQSLHRAEIFVQDFILTQLIGNDINEIWEICSPMAILKSILQREGKPEPEPRLIRETGRNTLFSVYVVGLYIDKEHFSEGAGETVSIAVEMAARDALRKLFRSTENHNPLPFGRQGRELNIDKEMISQKALNS